MRENKTYKRKLTLLVFTLASVLLLVGLNRSTEAQRSSEYESYVHTYLNTPPLGNWTYLEKPLFPVHFNRSQIAVGQNWSIVCPLMVNHSYHVYCFGEWINNGSEPNTDYDIYVYNPLGEMEGYHTSAAGLPEHLGTTGDETFFAPEHSGNYTFVVVNDARESSGSEAATFMIIEDVPCNVWHTLYVDGKNSAGSPVFNTSWAYEFATESRSVEVWVSVPPTLDMYEVRLYPMCDPQSKNTLVLNDFPLAWETSLFGERTLVIGGYNLESQKYRGPAYASCEFYGQDMFLNFTAPSKGKSLYHLVFIGETGSGTVDFLVKTEFNNTCLIPSSAPTRSYPSNDTVIAYVSDRNDLENASLQYSVNGGNATRISMEILNNKTCRAVVPGQSAGTLVFYSVEADDVLRNVLLANASYAVKYASTLSISSVHATVRLGENITINGQLTPGVEKAAITVYFVCGNETKEVTCSALADGSFIASFEPQTLGTWDAQARFEGSASVYECESMPVVVRVEEQPFISKYSLYIGGGLGAVAVVGLVVYFKKFKE